MDTNVADPEIIQKTLKCCLCDESFINTELRSQHYNEHNIDNDAVSRREQGNGDV